MKNTLEDGTEVEILPECVFCKTQVETLEHLFIDCEHVNRLWGKLEDCLNYSFTRPEKLLGCYEKTHLRNFDIISHLTILIKYYIHTCKVRKCIPYFSVFTKKIITTESTELSIATKNGKTKQHLDKWGDVITKFSF